MDSNSQSLKKGAVIRGGVYTYTIEKVLGQGSFGITYLASTRMKGPLGEVTVQVALKEFFARELDMRKEDGAITARTDGSFASRYAKAFQRESRNLSKMKHPGIVKVLEAFAVQGTLYYAMEYLSGGSLEDKIKGSGIPEEEALSYTRIIGDALEYLHSLKVMHLDLKPKNIMLNADGSPVIIDFGISKQFDKKGKFESSSPLGRGTPGFAPLEQAAQTYYREFQPTLDVYALGATLYNMLTGSVPPPSSEVLNDGFLEEPLLKKNVSRGTIEAIRKAMSPARKDRPQTIEEFIASLEDAESSKQDGTDDTTILLKRKLKNGVTKERNTKDPGRWYVLVGVLVALIILGLIVLLPKRPKQAQDHLFIDGVQSCSAEFPSNASERLFTIETNFEEEWCFSGVPEWCSVTTDAGNIILSVTENADKQERTGTIAIQKKGDRNVLGELTIIQKGMPVGCLNISSDPEGAAIWLDGINTTKKTPDILDGLAPGNHIVKLVREGYKNYMGTISILDGNNEELSVVLEVRTQANDSSRDRDRSIAPAPAATKPSSTSSGASMSDIPPTISGEAAKYYRDAMRGDAAAQCNLGYCYEYGKGVRRDYTEAMKWYRESAERGNAPAQYNIGNCYYYGKGTGKDYAEAIKWFKKAAEQGYASAQCNLGICYHYGKGISQDYSEAVKWYRKAADQGDADAQCNLGICYEYGNGVSKDYSEAAKWYRKAAIQGSSLAQCYLGECYEFGKGVSQDYNEARKWYQKAKDRGNKSAQECLDRIAGVG